MTCSEHCSCRFPAGFSSLFLPCGVVLPPLGFLSWSPKTGQEMAAS